MWGESCLLSIWSIVLSTIMSVSSDSIRLVGEKDLLDLARVPRGTWSGWIRGGHFESSDSGLYGENEVVAVVIFNVLASALPIRKASIAWKDCGSAVTGACVQLRLDGADPLVLAIDVHALDGVATGDAGGSSTSFTARCRRHAAGSRSRSPISPARQGVGSGSTRNPPPNSAATDGGDREAGRTIIQFFCHLVALFEGERGQLITSQLAVAEADYLILTQLGVDVELPSSTTSLRAPSSSTASTARAGSGPRPGTSIPRPGVGPRRRLPCRAGRPAWDRSDRQLRRARLPRDDAIARGGLHGPPRRFVATRLSAVASRPRWRFACLRPTSSSTRTGIRQGRSGCRWSTTRGLTPTAGSDRASSC